MGYFGGRVSPRGERGVYSSAFRRPCAVFLWILSVVALILAAPQVALASGEERTTLGDDLVIRTDTRWAGGTLGGYLPVRVEIANRGPARELVLEVTPSDRAHGATVKRVVGVDEHATVRFTLSIPLTAFRQGQLRVYDRRGELSSHERLIGGAAFLGVDTAPAMLVVSSRPVDCTGYIQATGGARDATRFGGVPVTDPRDPTALAEVVPRDSLPDSWIDYSGLDFVAISRADLAALRPSVRSAVLKWVHCGGNLIVHQAGKTSKDVETLERLLELNENAAVGARWTQSGKGKTAWPFATRQLMLGLVCAFPDQLPALPIAWSEFLNSVGVPRFSWMQRHGIAPDLGTEEFFNFMNPGIGGVPIYGFMVLITAFAVLIGPVNYFYLRRKRWLWLLLVTVPAMALVTSVLLVGYSVAAHGFSVRSRIRSLTVLDQKSHSAVSVARLALFAGVAPARGMQFSPETAVYPVFPPMVEPERARGRLDREPIADIGLAFVANTNAILDHSPCRAAGSRRRQGGTERGPRNRERIALGARGRACGRRVGPALVGAESFAQSIRAARRRFGDESDGLCPALGSEPSGASRQFQLTRLQSARRSPPESVQFHGAHFGGRHFDLNLMERLIQTWSRDLSAKKTCLLAALASLAVLRQNPGVDTGVGTDNRTSGLPLTAQQATTELFADDHDGIKRKPGGTPAIELCDLHKARTLASSAPSMA